MQMQAKHFAKLTKPQLLKSEQVARYLVARGKPRRLRDGSLWSVSPKCEHHFQGSF